MPRKKVKENTQQGFKSYRKRLEAEMIVKYPHYKLINGIIFTLFIISGLLLIWEIEIYRSTITSLYIPLLICLLPGLIAIPFLSKILNKYVLNPYNPGRLPLWSHFLINVIIVGGMSVFLFMSINYYFPKPPIYNLTLPIESTGTLAKGRNSCGPPYVIIDYNGIEKQLVFQCGMDVQSYHYVTLQMEEGFFGFEIILDKSLNATQ